MSELDELRLQISRVKGWKREYGRMDQASSKDHEYFIKPDGTKSMYPPDWPRDIAAAWGLVEEMNYSGVWSLSNGDGDSMDFRLILYCTPENFHKNMHPIFMSCDSAPEAICRAWLAWKERRHNDLAAD